MPETPERAPAGGAANVRASAAAAPSARSGWTGGQYSLVRALVALVLAASLAASAAGGPEVSLLAAALAVAALGLAVGAGGKPLAAMLALLFPFTLPDGFGSTATQVVGIWITLHLFLPPAPFGSAAALGRTDPGGGWSMPGWYAACWRVVFVAALVLGGLQEWAGGDLRVAGGLVAAGLLGVVRATAPAGWMLSLAVHVAAAFSGDDADLLGLTLFHLLTVQPAWIPRAAPEGVATVFYDGGCALCHGAVRFLVAEDAAPARFRVAPLDGPTFTAMVPEAVRVRRPDSIVVVSGNGVLLRGRAVIVILAGLGGLWRAVGVLLGLLPQALVDGAYDAMAARRHGWFGRRSESCPVMTAAQKERVDP